MATKAQKVAKKRAAEKARHRRAAKAKARVKARAKSNAAQKLRMEAAAKRAKSRTGTPNTRAVAPEVPKSSNATAAKPRVRLKPGTATNTAVRAAATPASKTSWLRKALGVGGKGLKVGGWLGAGLTAAQLLYAASKHTKNRSGNWGPPGGVEAMKDATVTANKPKATVKQADKPKQQDKPKATVKQADKPEQQDKPRAKASNTGLTVRPGRGGGRLARKASTASTGVTPRKGGGSYKGTGSSEKAATARKAAATNKPAADTPKPKVTVNTTKKQTSTAVTAKPSKPGNTTAKRRITKGNDGKPLTEFQSAFATARANGLKVFSYRGKRYTTEWATERQARLKAKQKDKPKAKRKTFTEEQWQAFSRRAKANEDRKEKRRASR